MQAHLEQSADQICNAILADVVAFAGALHPADDIALVALKRAPVA